MVPQWFFMHDRGVRNRATIPELVIWDWNGTLLDDFKTVLSVANSMLARRRLPVMTAARYRDVFDFPVETFYRIAGFDFEREPFPILADEFIRAFNAIVGECPLHEDAEQVLDGIRRAGIPQIVLSASREEHLRAGVEAHRLSRFFSGVHGLRDHLAVSKRDLGRDVIAGLPYARDRIVLIGDTTHDAEVAASMGVPVVLISRGHQSRDRLLETGAPVYRSLREWWDLIVAGDFPQ